MNSILRFFKSISNLRGQSTFPTRKSPILLSADKLIEEETLPCYDSKHYYPAHLGEVIKDR